MFFYVFLTTYCNDFVDLEQPYYRHFLDSVKLVGGGGGQVIFLVVSRRGGGGGHCIYILLGYGGHLKFG